MPPSFVHPTALNESDNVGEGTKLWAFVHVMRDAVVGSECNLGEQVFVESGAVLGDGVTVKNNVSIWRGVSLADYVFVGPSAMFTNDLFPRSSRNPKLQGLSSKDDWLVETHVGEGASIGAGAVVVAGVNIGPYAMVGAGSVVTRDVPPFVLVAGVPAKPVGFVCLCGRRLKETLSCGRCRRTYLADGDGLRELSA